MTHTPPNSIRCMIGLHDRRQAGRLRGECSRCKAVWYTDYFGSRASGDIIRYMVIDRNGNELPEMKRWDRHERDE